MNILRGDFHTHTKYSIEPKFGMGIFEIRALHGPEKLIRTAITRGLDALSITDHDTLNGSIAGERYVKKNNVENFTLIKGEEISTDKGHLIGLGLEETINPGLSPEETADKIREQGGVVIVPHPYTHYGIKDHTLTVKADAIEVFNTRYWITHLKKFRSGFYPKLADEKNFGKIANTDAHTLSIIGSTFTEVKSEHGTDNVIRAFRKRGLGSIKQASFLRSTYAIARAISLMPLFWRPQSLL